jgi:hypothetical protein
MARLPLTAAAKQLKNTPRSHHPKVKTAPTDLARTIFKQLVAEYRRDPGAMPAARLSHLLRLADRFGESLPADVASAPGNDEAAYQREKAAALEDWHLGSGSPEERDARFCAHPLFDRIQRERVAMFHEASERTARIQESLHRPSTKQKNRKS